MKESEKHTHNEDLFRGKNGDASQLVKSFGPQS